jgi:hypothetical protein
VVPTAAPATIAAFPTVASPDVSFPPSDDPKLDADDSALLNARDRLDASPTSRTSMLEAMPSPPSHRLRTTVRLPRRLPRLLVLLFRGDRLDHLVDLRERVPAYPVGRHVRESVLQRREPEQGRVVTGL